MNRARLFPIGLMVVAMLRAGDAESTGISRGPAEAVDLMVYRADSESVVTYHYLLRNRSSEDLHNFMIGNTLTSHKCPELQEAPVGFHWETARCPGSIVIPKPWEGCVSLQEECEGLFLEFDYQPHFQGLAKGDSLAFSVRVEAEDSAYERASFWIVGSRHEYEGQARKVQVRPGIVLDNPGPVPAWQPWYPVAGQVYDYNPVPTSYARPWYPMGLVLKTDTVVVVHVLVGEDGRVQDRRIVQGVPELNDSVLAASAKWTFEPARRDGKAVSLWIEIPFRFIGVSSLRH